MVKEPCARPPSAPGCPAVPQGSPVAGLGAAAGLGQRGGAEGAVDNFPARCGNVVAIWPVYKIEDVGSVRHLADKWNRSSNPIPRCGRRNIAA